MESYDLASNSLGTSSSTGVNGTLGEKPGPLLLKILVPAYAAGSIIGEFDFQPFIMFICILGKQGQTITQLQKDSGAVIKLSKAKDFYTNYL